jgi:hypothetical protein
MSKHKFVILLNGKLHVYENYEDIPEIFDHVIEFRPYIPDTDQHTHEEHDEISEWNNKLKELMKRERSYASRY